MEANLDRCGLTCKSLVALTYLLEAEGPPVPARAARAAAKKQLLSQILSHLESSLRVQVYSLTDRREERYEGVFLTCCAQGRTAYVTYSLGSGSAGAALLEENAWVLMALTQGALTFLLGKFNTKIYLCSSLGRWCEEPFS